MRPVDIQTRILSLAGLPQSSGTGVPAPPDSHLSDVDLAAKMLADGFSHIRLSDATKQNVRYRSVSDLGRLMEEVLARHIGGIEKQGLLPKTQDLFRLAAAAEKSLDVCEYRLAKASRSAKGSPSEERLLLPVRAEIDRHGEVLRPHYPLTQAMKVIYNLPGPVKSFFYETASTQRGFARLAPQLKAARERIDATNKAFESMDNQELCSRAIRAMANAKPIYLTPGSPVYGTMTLLSYAPAMMSGLLSPAKKDNEGRIDELMKDIGDTKQGLDALTERLDRVLGRPVREKGESLSL